MYLAWFLTFTLIPQWFYTDAAQAQLQNLCTLNNELCCSRGLARTVAQKAGVYPTILCMCRADLQEVQP